MKSFWGNRVINKITKPTYSPFLPLIYQIAHLKDISMATNVIVLSTFNFHVANIRSKMCLYVSKYPN